MTDSINIMLALLRREICQQEDVPLPASLPDPMLMQIYQTALRHDLFHPISSALRKNGLCPEGSSLYPAFRRQQLQTVFRCELLINETVRICDALNEAQIPHILLKGAHIRRYYPSPEMRSSSDLDLLIRPEALDAVRALLCGELHFTYLRQSDHDVQFQTPSGVLLELHFTLPEAVQSPALAAILGTVWDDAVPDDDAPFTRTLSPEMLRLHHIAHMRKHFTYSGCGIRFFLDLWLLEHRAPAADRAKLDEMLRSCGLYVFARASAALAEVWFSGQPYDSLTADMAPYVLAGGVYGSVNNRVRLEQIEHKSRLGYLLRRIFPPLSSLRYRYPILQKCPFLLPFCQIHRWFRLLSAPTARRISGELQTGRTITADSREEVRSLLNRLEL